jgi:hypothetical protein
MPKKILSVYGWSSLDVCEINKKSHLLNENKKKIRMKLSHEISSLLESNNGSSSTSKYLLALVCMH